MGTKLPTHIQHVYLHNSMKMLACHVTRSDKGDHKQILEGFLVKLEPFVNSSDLEVQERASSFVNLLKQLSKLMMGDTNISDLFSSMFRGELNPVAPKAQKRVPVPEGLDLDKWINDPPSSSSESEEEDVRENVRNNFYLTSEKPKRAPELSPEQVKKIREARKAEQASNPHYLQAKVAKAAVESGYQKPDLEQESDKSSEVSDISTKFSKMRTSEQYLKQEQQRRREARRKARRERKAGGRKQQKKKKKLRLNRSTKLRYS